MSTSYYRPTKPITDIIQIELAGKITLGLKIDGEYKELSQLTKESAVGITKMFCDLELGWAMKTIYGGGDIGNLVSERLMLAPTDILISECGDIVTVAEVRAKAGAGKVDKEITNV